MPKLFCSLCGVSAHIVMEEPLIHTPLCRTFPLHVLLFPPQDVTVELGIYSVTSRNKFLTNNSLSVKETDQHWLDVASHLISFLWLHWTGTVPLGWLLFHFGIIPINKLSSPETTAERSSLSFLTYSWHSLQITIQYCFWSSLSNRGTDWQQSSSCSVVS